jgi:hypothetical protein
MNSIQRPTPSEVEAELSRLVEVHDAVVDALIQLALQRGLQLVAVGECKVLRAYAAGRSSSAAAATWLKSQA